MTLSAYPLMIFDGFFISLLMNSSDSYLLRFPIFLFGFASCIVVLMLAETL